MVSRAQELLLAWFPVGVPRARRRPGRWLELQQSGLKPKTLSGYETSVRVHPLPALGRRKVQDVTISDVAALVVKMQKARERLEANFGGLL